MPNALATFTEVAAPTALPAPGKRSVGRIFLTRLIAVPFLLLLLGLDDAWDAHRSMSVENALIVCGLAAVSVAILGRLWCTLYIGGRKTKSLVTQGPYSLCRNPLYFFSALGVAGLAATTGMITIIAVVIAAFAIYYPRVIAGEESRLMSVHGAAFAEYCERTPRFLPSFKNFHETECVEFRPLFLYKAARDASGFAAAWLLMLAINMGHDFGLLPVWARLY